MFSEDQLTRISKAEDLYTSAKTDAFTTFLRKMVIAFPPPEKPTNIVMNPLASAMSPSLVPPAEEETTAVNWRKGKVSAALPPTKMSQERFNLEGVFKHSPAYTMTGYWAFLKNHYLKNPDAFRVSHEGHISGDDTQEHITITVNIPFEWKEGGWEALLHAYYTVGLNPKTKKDGYISYTHVTGAVNEEVQTVVVFHARDS